VTRAWRRRLGLGLPTVLGLARRGFFIPYRYAGRPRRGGNGVAYPLIEARLRERERDFLSVLAAVDGFADDLGRMGSEPPPAPRWDQEWFPAADAAVAYALVRTTAPARLVEIGAGHSTRFFARAVADGGLATRITVVDPAPRAALAGLAVEHRATTLQEAADDTFAALAAGDVVSIDSSHVLMPGTDVDVLVTRLLPMLPSGVLVHVHDIFLPDDYPDTWQWRGYNEQSAVAALLASGGWRVEWAGRYAATRMAEAWSASTLGALPPASRQRASSLWLRQR
jgi:predicted O-methyltransferase YrrM